jgi:hypothetical protein
MHVFGVGAFSNALVLAAAAVHASNGAIPNSRNSGGVATWAFASTPTRRMKQY